MPRFFVTLSYNGRNYVGWQIQPNGTSVQQVMQNALSVILRESVQIVGAGRTDAGVHARRMIAHFDWSGGAFSPGDLVDKLNQFFTQRHIGHGYPAGETRCACPFQCALAHLQLSYYHPKRPLPSRVNVSCTFSSRCAADECIV